MSNEKPKAVYEPGTLDEIRKNIGAIDPEEAKKLSKQLGGEVFREKSAPINTTALQSHNRTYAHKAVVGKSGAHLSEAYHDKKDSLQPTASSSANDHKKHLPKITQQTNTLLNKLMQSSHYNMKSDFGFLNFIKLFQKNGTEKVSSYFINTILQRSIEHMDTFIEGIESLLKIAPETYKFQIKKNHELKFQFLNAVSSWSTKDLKSEYIKIKNKQNVLVEDLIDIISSIYKMVICIAYISDKAKTDIMKEFYKEFLDYKKENKRKISTVTKIILTEWLYIDNNITKGFYPLLLRMIGGEFSDLQTFFNHRISEILKFLGLSKYSLVLPKKITKQAKENKNTEKDTLNQDPQKKDQLVEQGLKLLDRIFPEAGFLNLDKFPDLYPYFQPLYKFKNGMVLLSPKNPLHITIILIRILEDFFQGCRKIKFEYESDDKTNDKLSKALDEWSFYRELLFEKDYCDYLTTLANELYTDVEFEKSQYGKKLLTTLLWLAKYNFLPKLKFDQLLLERPENMQRYLPLSLRISFLKNIFTIFTLNITKSQKTKGKVSGIKNPWDRYDFGLPNPVSKRLDVLLGAKKIDTETSATNACLIKYTLCIISVLNWWINGATSPVYKSKANPEDILRCSSETGEPEFSIPVKDNQDTLFAETIKSQLSQTEENCD